ncbi:P-loop containing nucleoside triphosphate hydrolase protein [Rhexocercosporidium sp. MPI-PUGE-AT-0058]|nr:P-loop containing nucleoside triphosphate hydrolase protein [Rhexocercosporidium sp. MPI-PUGE-AT-0058]
MLYGRRALKGFRKLGGLEGDAGTMTSLMLLVTVCQDEGNHDEGDAFTAILNDFRAKKVADLPALIEGTQASQEDSSMAPTASKLSSGRLHQSNQHRGYPQQVYYPLREQPDSIYLTGTEQNPRDQPPPGISSTMDLQQKYLQPFENTEMASTTNLSTDETQPVSNKPSPDMNSFDQGYAPAKKVIIVGGVACGKTAFLMFAKYGAFPIEHNPTPRFDNRITISADYFETLSFVDTPGHEYYGLDRINHYKCTRVCVLAFAINNPDSLGDVRKKWLIEARKYAPLSPVLLLGLKSDLRNDSETIERLAKSSQHPVTIAEARNIQGKIGATLYLECSALTGEGVQKALGSISKEAMKKPKLPKPKEIMQRRLGWLFGRRS